MFKGLFGSRSQRHYARGIEHFNAGQMIEAIGCFEEAIEADEGGPDSALARFYRAEAHAGLGAASLERGDIVAALVHFDAALEEHTRFPDLHIQRAIALLHSGDPLAAERAARTALTLNPEFVDAGAVLVVALRRQGDQVRSRDAATQWARIAAGKGSPLAAEFVAEDGGEAELLFDALVLHRARRLQRRRIVEHAESCLRDGFWAEAAQALAPLVEETPQYPDLRLRLAAARLGQDELDAAAAELDAALQSNPHFADAHVLAGIVHLRLDQVRRARDHFDAADESGRVPLVAIYGRVLCDLRTGNLIEALASMDRLAGEDVPPEDARALHAILESLAGRRETARERFDALVAESRRTDHLLDAIVWATEHAEADLAHRALERIDDADRTRIDVIRAHANLRLKEGATDRARQLCESALLNHPTDGGLLLDLARILADLGEGAAGLRCLEALSAGAAGSAGARVLRARLLRLDGRDDDARRELQAPGTAPDAAGALELLYLCRAADEGTRAQDLYDLHAQSSAPSLAWRAQDPARWLGPLRPWPAEMNVVHSRA